MNVQEFQKKYNRLPTEFDKDYLKELEREKIMTKVHITDLPMMAPGKCTNCGSTKTDRKYIDWGLDLDFYGVVYICTFCFMEIFKAAVKDKTYFGRLQELVEIFKDDLDFSFLQPTEIASPVSVEDNVEKIKEIAEDLHKRLGKILYVQPDATGDSNIVITDNQPTIDVVSVESKKEPDDSTVVRAKSRVTKSDTGPGRKKLPGFTGLKIDE